MVTRAMRIGRRALGIAGILLGVLIGGGAGEAETWTQLDGSGIRAALDGRKLVYDGGAWQEFRTSGRTLYNAGSDSWGYWRVESDRYCSMWPPSDLWACYRMDRKGERLRFVSEGGDVTEARYDD